jgi:hypothetical protein
MVIIAMEGNKTGKGEKRDGGIMSKNGQRRPH